MPLHRTSHRRIACSTLTNAGVTLSVSENDFIDSNVIFDSLDTKYNDYVLRDNMWNIFAKGEDVAIDVACITANRNYTYETTLYVCDKDSLSEEKKEIEYYKQDYDLKFSFEMVENTDNDYFGLWTMKFKDTKEEVVFPSAIAGSKTSLNNTFRYSTKIKSVVIMTGVAEIADYAFQDAKNLTKVAIPANKFQCIIHRQSYFTLQQVRNVYDFAHIFIVKDIIFCGICGVCRVNGNCYDCFVCSVSVRFDAECGQFDIGNKRRNVYCGFTHPNVSGNLCDFVFFYSESNATRNFFGIAACVSNYCRRVVVDIYRTSISAFYYLRTYSRLIKDCIVKLRFVVFLTAPVVTCVIAQITAFALNF